MDFSVILCTWNSAEHLEQTLNAFCACVPPKGREWELVVVNNNSTDGTEAVVASFLGRLPINYAYEPRQGLSHARNTGLLEASGELIVFTDDDVFPCKKWLQVYWRAYQQRPCGYYFGGPVTSRFEAESPDDELLRHAPWSVRGLNYGAEDRALKSSERFLAANWACPRKYLDEVGGFDPALGLNPDNENQRTSEEKDLMKRLGAMNLTAWYLKEAEIEHFVPSVKCTIDHIASRKEAVAYSSYLIGDGKSDIFTILGIPLGLYKAYILLLIEWGGKYVAGRNWIASYMEWRKLLGKIRGHRESKRVDSSA